VPKNDRVGNNFSCRKLATGRTIFVAMNTSMINLTPESPDYLAELRTIGNDMSPVIYAQKYGKQSLAVSYGYIKSKPLTIIF